MSKALKLYSQQPNGQTFADPTDPDYTVRFKTNVAPKVLDGQRTTNYVTEIVINDIHDVSIGDKVTGDALSVRLKVSGSVESIDQLKKMVSDLSSQIDQWMAEDVLTGFPINTLPTISS